MGARHTYQPALREGSPTSQVVIQGIRLIIGKLRESESLVGVFRIDGDGRFDVRKLRQVITDTYV